MAINPAIKKPSFRPQRKCFHNFKAEGIYKTYISVTESKKTLDRQMIKYRSQKTFYEFINLRLVLNQSQQKSIGRYQTDFIDKPVNTAFFYNLV